MTYFFERGVKLLRAGGVLSFISSNSFFNSAFGEKLRHYLKEKLTIRTLIDFAEAKVFTAITEPCIFIATTGTNKQQRIAALKWPESQKPDNVDTMVQQSAAQIPQSQLGDDGWRLESPVVLGLLDKMRRAGKPLGELVSGRCFYGIKTGLNEAFVVDRATRDRLKREHKASADILKPFMRGRDVKRWRTALPEQYLIKIESSENKKHPWSGKPEKEAETLFAETWPAIYDHFQSLKEVKLEKPDDRGCRNMLEKLQRRDDQGTFFWELRSCAYWQEFEQPKIVYQDIARYFGMAWDESGSFLANTCYFIPRAEKWLLGVLLSSSMLFYVQKVLGSDEGGFIRLFSIHVEKFPIPAPPADERLALDGLVERILKAKQTSATADVSDLEREINDRVQRLYGLTKDEIKIVEQAVK